MLRKFTVLGFAAGALVIGADRYFLAQPAAAEVALPLLKATEPADVCLLPPLGYGQAAAASSVPADWPGKNVTGGDVVPVRIVADPYPTFDGIAVDSENGVVVMSDENRGTLLMYESASGGHSPAITEPWRHIVGPRVNLGFIAGVAVDPVRREAFVVNNDGGGVVVHSYDSHGDVKPLRELDVPHQSWGLSLDLKYDELAVTSQQYQGVSIYKRSDSGAARPVRTIRGEDTQLADPHGVFLDSSSAEIFVANHGNWTEMRSYAADGPAILPGEYVPGRFEQPSVRVYQASANGNVPPIRTIQGAGTKLAWPMGLTVDVERNEVVVANYGSNEILVFSKTASGNVAPSRVIGGDRTGIVGPVGVGIDTKKNELWVANYGDHTAVVFDRAAAGNVEPKRIIRNAPAGTPTTGFTNASAAAYDSKREEVLVPN